MRSQARKLGGTMNFNLTPAINSIDPVTTASKIVVPRSGSTNINASIDPMIAPGINTPRFNVSM
jgi:hypothetical protein